MFLQLLVFLVTLILTKVLCWLVLRPWGEIRACRNAEFSVALTGAFDGQLFLRRDNSKHPRGWG